MTKMNIRNGLAGLALVITVMAGHGAVVQAQAANGPAKSCAVCPMTAAQGAPAIKEADAILAAVDKEALVAGRGEADEAPAGQYAAREEWATA